MKTLSLALAATAIAATSSTLLSPAHAGGRGHHGLHFHLYQLQQQQSYYRHDDDDDYVARRRQAAKAAKPAEKPAEKPVAVAKYADGKGRQFDLVSKVWFDGKSQCWMGDKAFVFKSGTWLYGDARWIETDGNWSVAAGDKPEQVSCDGIKAFETKLQTAKTTVEPKVEKVEVKPIAKVVTTTSTATATAASKECKKYFPSVGEMVAVPCNE